MNGGYHGRSHPSDKMLPKERAHGKNRPGCWPETTQGEREVLKKRHRKKSRAHGKKIIEEQQP